MAPRIDSAKPSIAPKVQTTAPVAKAEVPTARATTPASSGFESQKKKLMSVSGRYVAHRPVVAERLDLKDLISGPRLAQQAGNSSPSLSQLLTGPTPNAEAGIASVFAEVQGNSMNAKTDSEVLAEVYTLSPGPGGTREKLIASVKAGKVTDAATIAALLKSTMSGKEAAGLLKGMPKKALESLKSVMRRGELTRVASVALGIELAAQTDWGKKNPKVIDGLRAALGDDKIKANLKEGLGATENGEINLKEDLLKNPEAMAAILAHEGVHVHQGSDCCGGKGATSIAGETEGNVAQAQVWSQLGNPKDPAGYTAQLNAYSEAYKTGGAGAVKARVGQMYLKNAEEKLAARKAETPEQQKARDADDNVAAWDAMVKGLKSELEKK